jgi:hypothetical protein
MVGSSGQEACLGLQPVADGAGALLAIGWPALREAVIHHVVGFDAEGFLDEFGGAVAVFAADGLDPGAAHLALVPATELLDRLNSTIILEGQQFWPIIDTASASSSLWFAAIPGIERI